MKYGWGYDRWFGEGSLPTRAQAATLMCKSFKDGAIAALACALADLRKALEKLDRTTEAAHAYEACLRVDPDRADAHYQLARVYKKQKRSSDSARELATARKLQQEKRVEQETLLQASGTHGDPIHRGEGLLRLPAANDKSQ